MKKASIAPNIEIAYTDSDKGKETILFIHGLASYTGVWRENIPELSKNFRCIALDLPGNGHSSKGDFPFSMFFYAESVVKFLTHLGLTEVNICGHSMGGQIAQIIALRYPSLVKRLILAAPAGFEFYNNHDKIIVKNMMRLGNFIYSE